MRERGASKGNANSAEERLTGRSFEMLRSPRGVEPATMASTGSRSSILSQTVAAAWSIVLFAPLDTHAQKEEASVSASVGQPIPSAVELNRTDERSTDLSWLPWWRQTLSSPDYHLKRPENLNRRC